jgi:hypothetical protein
MKMKNCSGVVEDKFTILLNLIAESIAFIVVISKASPSGRV